MSSVARRRRHGRGQLVREEGVALIEFALVLPLLLLLVVGIVDFGKAFYNSGSLGLKNHCVTKPVKVSLSYSYSFLPYLGLGSFTIKASSTMRLEKDWAGNAATGVHAAGGVYDVAPGTASNDTC